MYACLHVKEAAWHPVLLSVAQCFSPEVEQTSAGTVMFSIGPLRALLGSWPQIAAEIGRRGHEQKLLAHLAIAANPDTAVLVARHSAGVTLITPGEEALHLAKISLAELLQHDALLDPALLTIFAQWGVKDCGELACLPETGVAERLGAAGVYLRNLALGLRHRPLRIAATETDYEERIECDYAIEQLVPLLFLFGRALHALCERLRSQAQAARLLDIKLSLDGGRECRHRLEFPVPLDDSASLLKLLQLHLERHPTGAGVLGFTLRLEATEPRRVQGGLYLPPTPRPDKLQVTLARIAGLVGEEHVGTPLLEDSYRPDAFRLVKPDLQPFQPGTQHFLVDPKRLVLRFSLRLFRPALAARVQVKGHTPKQVWADTVQGRVLESSGPWKTSGGWWTPQPWDLEEWDVALDDGALYRLGCQMPAEGWSVVGSYD